MNKSYNSLGLMSGTSGDGIDASVIETDGKTQYKVLKNQFFEYPFSITRQIHKLKEEITNPNELLTHSKDIELIAEQITDYHANAANEMIHKHDIDLIGFHGQTIYHNSDQKISKQIGSGEKLSKITKKKPKAVLKPGIAAQAENLIEKNMVSYYKIPVAYEIKGKFLGFIKFKRAVSKSNKMLNFDNETVSVVKGDSTGTIIARGELTIVGLPDEFF